MPSVAEITAFRELFRGLPGVYGTGRGQTVHSNALPFHYRRHLLGQGPGLGIHPLLRDGTVRFAAIDLDEPDIALVHKFAAWAPPGPGWVELTRSGNYHLWYFFDRPASAAAVRDRLRFMTAQEGRPEVEVFPKQDALLRPDAVGNYINLPYFGNTRPVIMDGRALALSEFLAAVQGGARARADEWEAAALPSLAARAERPPSEWGQRELPHSCLGHIAQGIFGGERPPLPGARNIVMFNACKMLLNTREHAEDPETAFAWFRVLNDSLPEPLPEQELEDIFNNVLSRQYTSTGCDQPEMLPYIEPGCPIAGGTHG